MTRKVNILEKRHESSLRLLLIFSPNLDLPWASILKYEQTKINIQLNFFHKFYSNYQGECCCMHQIDVGIQQKYLTKTRPGCYRDSSSKQRLSSQFQLKIALEFIKGLLCQGIILNYVRNLVKVCWMLLWLFLWL